MKGHVISIIVPVYNVELYLQDCIDSILNQTYKQLEIILVNDGSTDGGGEICDEYAKCDDRIKVIHKKNGGLSDARNTGIQVCKGEYISFVDSDDILHVEFINVLFQNLISNNALISCCNFQSFTDSSDLNYDLYETEVEIFTGNEFLGMLYDPKWVPQNVVMWNKIYHKSIFEKLRFPLGKLHEDEFVFHEIYDGKKTIVYTDVKLYFYRKHGASITKNYSLQNYYDAKEAHIKRIEFGKVIMNRAFVNNTKLNLLKKTIHAFYSFSFDKNVKKEILKKPYWILQLYLKKHYNAKEIIYLLYKLMK
ncbi:glycosyltransferase family 2 protein [Epilithonimonas lactis]|uniref:glycosyltransferase family 2 protein n=1 Tax=Epilithonimonas lactis TaxID=421072 RepID=UPI00068A3D16|nr:glycosyltransferase [Epilithonimonas lactis]SEQ06244.1 Glycosyltransferase involved in cell wall bisynthesis [Epilithonimonas lactis]